MDAPKDIIAFEKLMFYSIGIGVFAGFIALGAIEGGYGTLFIFLLLAISGLMYWLVRLISQKGNITAKWVLTVLFGMGAIITISELPEELNHGFKGVFSLAQLILQSIAVYKLFTTQSVQWFESKVKSSDSDVQAENLKKCPFCAEFIKSEAIKCKHCGSDIS